MLRKWRVAGGTLAALMLPTVGVAQVLGTPSVRQLFAPSHKGIIVVAHRGCHEEAPHHSFSQSPENSRVALEHCVAMGVDMMEADVRMTADGFLVIIHDSTVDRTTDGHGTVAQMTLSDIRKLHLRQNLGGYAEPSTDERVMTLDEILQAAKGRITLNLDVKDAIYAEVVAAVLRADAAEMVNVKTRAGIASPALATTAPFDRVPFIPILDAAGSTLEAVAERQSVGAKPLAYELPHMNKDELGNVAAVGQKQRVKLFCNTLGDGFLKGVGGDNDALRDPDAVWGWSYRNGISAIQTDRPEALLEFRTKMKQ